jgi:hypothetical protein
MTITIEDLRVQQFKDVLPGQFFITQLGPLAFYCLRGVDVDDGLNQAMAVALSQATVDANPPIPPELPFGMFGQAVVAPDGIVGTLGAQRLSPDMRTMIGLSDAAGLTPGGLFMREGGDCFVNFLGPSAVTMFMNVKDGKASRTVPTGRFGVFANWSVVLERTSHFETAFTVETAPI